MTKSAPHEQLPWWNYNLPEEQWTDACPENLKGSSEKDKGIIGCHDSDFVPMDWTQVKHLVGKFMIGILSDFHAS